MSDPLNSQTLLSLTLLSQSSVPSKISSFIPVSRSLCPAEQGAVALLCSEDIV